MFCDTKTTDIKGVVTATNKKLWSFDLDGSRVVYMAHLAAFQATPCLPQLGSSVSIKHAHYEAAPPWFINQEPKVLYLCDESDLECDLLAEETSTPLLNLIRRRNLTLEGLKGLLARIKGDFTLVCKENVVDFACCVYESLEEFDCVFKTPSQCKYVNSVLDGVVKGPYWSFGCHPSRKNEVLLGKFSVFKGYGLFMLGDFDYKIMCVIKGGDRWDLLSLIDHFVLVRNYVVFTEVLQGFNRGIDYLVCDVSDVRVVNFDDCCEKGGCNNKQNKNSSTVLLLKKSMPLLNKQNQPYFLLQLQEQNQTFFLTVTNLQIYQFLQIGCSYHLTHNNSFVETINYELKRLFPNCICYKLHDEHPNFEFHAKQTQDGDILTVEEAICTLQTNNGVRLFTFQGTIKEKDFCKPLSSRTKRNVNVLAYGTPGAKTHILYLQTDNCKQETITLYLNNWETMQMPFGLLPNMRVLVRNVQQQKKYFKSTLLTTFEILDYAPKIPFETASLRTEDGFDGNWGRPFNLGTGFLLPNAVLVYTQVETLKIRSLRLFHACQICPKTRLSCSEHDLTLQTTMTMVVTDSGGKAMVICKSLEVLRAILDVPKNQWKDFCASCQTLDSYQYDRFAKVEPLDFSGALTTAIHIINEIGFVDVEMLCRKLESKQEDNDMLPLWLCVDARKK